MWAQSGSAGKQLVRLGKHVVRCRGRGKEKIKIMNCAWPVGKAIWGKLLSPARELSKL